MASVKTNGEPRKLPKLAEVAVKIFSKRRRPEDTGLGDTVHRLLGGDAFPTWFHAVFGRDCGCADRQRWLNQRFPYR